VGAGILIIEGVTTLAMGFDRVRRSQTTTSQRVVARCHWLDVARIAAGSTPAKMIALKTVRNWPDQYLVAIAMGRDRVPMRLGELAVAELVDVSRPHPAPIFHLMDLGPEPRRKTRVQKLRAW
jgi:hypothetical protein